MSATDSKTHITKDVFQVPSYLLGKPLASPKRRLLALTVDLLIITTISKVSWEYTLSFGSLLILLTIFMKRKRKQIRKRTTLIISLVLFILLLMGSIGILGNYYYHKFKNMSEGKFKSKSDSIQYSKIFEQARTAISKDSVASAELEQALQNKDLQHLPSSVQKIITSINPQLELNSDSISSEDIQIVATFSRAYSQRDSAVIHQLLPRMSHIVSGNQLKILQNEINSLYHQNSELNGKLAEYQSKLSDPSIEYLLKGLINDLGFTFGFAGFYFIFFLMWFNGYTPGKRLLGIQVIRLNGEPIGIWNAFERYGGYTAGIATGLLGFLQVFWDDNRQALHDKIAGTTVIRSK